MNVDADIAVIGAGFSGSLMALLLRQIGLKPVLIDRGMHPRFAIGESSTPLANLILEDLAKRYDLPRIAPLANYMNWKQKYPEIVVGLKRGFSYFHHSFDMEFRPREDRSNELLVAASRSNEDADTHWMRSDFDSFLANEAISAGIPYFDNTVIHETVPSDDGWRLLGGRRETERSNPLVGHCTDTRSDEIPLSVNCRFVIDASGEGGFLSKALGIGPHRDGLKTRSRALFSHFTDVHLWNDLYAGLGGDLDDHPFPCDDAALHHVFDGGWMWVLRFDNGITSAGFSLDPERFPFDKTVTPEEEWSHLMKRLPSVAEQFAQARPIVPWRQTGRMQRRLETSSGSNWVMLPNTATFLDPLHSTGNAFTLVGIERLMLILERCWGQPKLADELKKYDSLVQTETEYLDGIVSGSFAGFRDFERMISLSMFYFASATWSEEERRAGRMTRGSAFLSADHPNLKMALAQANREVSNPNVSTEDFTNHIRTAIALFNRIGLCDVRRKNLYPYDV